ncbi:CTTNBP2 N-terminal-like protein [Seriola lalandi dorsalis]|uniref:CTTNBP2 N-terminal like n=1 Tax=Seriola lalandi dorsalis TaxID=1841481 RepID=A0A3B4X3K5_SERLL|nr:CTTNBP2 N-terminal-like protein [Seriola lalandi dorsalis]XP_056258266.1 CTTNBP2 N-terminal-like protein [Seriola aureovittata]
MLEFSKTPEGHMKSKLNMESLSKPELLMLFSILEGELEARDLVIDALKAQRKELFIQERYGKYNLSDPFLALQRDSEAMGGQNKDPGCSSSSVSNPLVVLKLVVSHCRRMQEKMLAQLAAAESRHRRVIADLEEEKRRHAEDTAEGDDVTYILEKERERLQQQLEFERSQVRRLEKEQRRITDQLEEERAQHKQLSCALAKECKWASARALEEGHRLTELSRKLDKEKEACQALKKELEDERRRALRMEARVEEQLAEFDTEREQLRSRLKKEEAHCCQLQQQVEELKRNLEEVNMTRATAPAEAAGKEWATKVPPGKTTLDTMKVEDIEEDSNQPPAQPKVNGHHCPLETNGHHGPNNALSEKICLQNGNENPSVHQTQMSISSCNAAPSALPPPSPCASPVLAKRPPGSPSPGSYQSPYQAGINQRFHAARHKFQGTTDPEPQSQATPPALPLSPKDLSPVTSTSSQEASPVKQMARSTVTQVLSRFTTVQQSATPKLVTPNNSPFGTDYRSLAAPLSPIIGRAAAALPQGIRSPTIPRADRGNPPPIPPKKPGLAQAPPSPAAVPRSASHFSDSPLSGSCGLTSNQEGVKELDVVVSSN